MEIWECFLIIVFCLGYVRPRDWNEEREIRAEASRVKGFKGKREYSWVVTHQGKVIGQSRFLFIKDA